MRGEIVKENKASSISVLLEQGDQERKNGREGMTHLKNQQCA